VARDASNGWNAGVSYHIAMRIAFFGGSFDPPHLGHLAVARAARETVAIDTILFAPVGNQPLKTAGALASFEDRVAMTRLAIANQPGLELSLIDKPSNQPNYTIHTLTRLRDTLPAGAELFLLLGADAYRSLPQWHRAQEVPTLARLIVAARPGEILPSEHPGILLLPGLNYEISATEIRDRIRNQIHGDPSNLPPLLPPAVLTYIHEHNLYE
jgi:nicotinate-nucleotide adenylyltransferase